MVSTSIAGAKKQTSSRLRCRSVDRSAWPEIVELFGKNGACGGCWCMHWRHRRGEDWHKVKGATNKRRLKRLIEQGQLHAELAYSGDQAVAWCQFGKRESFERLQRSPSLHVEDAHEVWAIVCFFVLKEYRGQGVATELLNSVVKRMRKLGAKNIEGYPTKNPNPGQSMPAPFAWTGTESLFQAAGFKNVQPKAKGKQRYRLIVA